ncbi:VOC family protein [soil metagenome]
MLPPPDAASILDEVNPLHVHHVSINVENAEESIAFYTEVLGGTVRDDRPDFGFGGAWINLGSTQVHLIEGSVPPALGQHFALLFENVDDVVDELRGRGLAVNDAKVVGPNRQTFIEDPSGNTIELHQLGHSTNVGHSTN